MPTEESRRAKRACAEPSEGGDCTTIPAQTASIFRTAGISWSKRGGCFLPGEATRVCVRARKKGDKPRPPKIVFFLGGIQQEVVSKWAMLRCSLSVSASLLKITPAFLLYPGGSCTFMHPNSHLKPCKLGTGDGTDPLPVMHHFGPSFLPNYCALHRKSLWVDIFICL